MKKRTAKEIIPAAALMLALCLMLGGCDSWRRSASSDAISVNGSEIQELPDESPEEEVEEEPAEEPEEQGSSQEMVCAEIINYGDGSLFWNTEDEVIRTSFLQKILMGGNMIIRQF